MSKEAKAQNYKDFLKKFQKETLAVVERAIEKENEKQKLVICIVNDMAFPAVQQKATDYIAKNKGINILPLSGLWQAFFDGKYQLTNEVVTSKILYDGGLIKMLRDSLILRESLIKKFEKYLISIVLFGSWSRGTAVTASDIDIGVVIDDTDVKETTRIELKEKIRKIVLGMAAETSKKFNCQTYLLTEFWEYVRDANPVIFTLLRDGVPLTDKGLFAPWRLLLRMGRIKPTPEAIQSFIASGKLLTKMVKSNMTEMLIEKLYYSMLNPAQAALMFMGIAPPAYSETPHLLKRYFVDKKKLDAKYAIWLDEMIKLRKTIEHEQKQEVKGAILDKYIKRSEEFSNAIDKLFEKMRKEVIGEKIREIDYLTNKGIRQIISAIGIKINEENMAYQFRNLVEKHKIMPATYTEFLGYLDHIKQDYKRGLVTQEEVNRLERTAHDFIESAINFARTRETAGTDKFRIKFNHQGKEGELWVLGREAFIIKDVQHPEKEVYAAKISPSGKLSKPKQTTVEKITSKRKEIKAERTATVKEQTIESLKAIFGKDLEIVIG